MVQVLLNIAYAPRVVVKKFAFGPGMSITFKEAIDVQMREQWGECKQLEKEREELERDGGRVRQRTTKKKPSK